MSLIYSTEELEKFYTTVMMETTDDETYFVSLSTRKKYLTDEEREEYQLRNAEMYCRRTSRARTFTRFLHDIERMGVKYYTSNGKVMPEKATVCYIMVNPRSLSLASSLFMKEMMDDVQHVMAYHGQSSKMNKPESILRTCIQKSRSQRVWIDIDIDVDRRCEELVLDYYKELRSRYTLKCELIKTKSGYHLLLHSSENEYTKEMNPDIIVKSLERMISLFYEQNNIDTKWEVIRNKDEMIPLPGTYQGGFKVRMM